MRKTYIILLACSLVLAVVAVVVAVSSAQRGTISYHLDRLGQLRQSTAWKTAPDRTGTASDFLRPKVWLWYLRGAPSGAKLLREKEEHQQALIRLGYFERRELTLNHRTLDGQLWSQFQSSVSNSPLSDWRWFVHLDDSRPSVIRVTASKADIPIFERIVREIDTE